MITMMIGKSPANAAPVRGLYVDGELVATFCALTTARDLRSQLLNRCGIKKHSADADDRLEGAYTKVFCEVDHVSKFPAYLPGEEPVVEVAPEPEAVDVVLTVSEPAIEGAPAEDSDMVVAETPLTPAQKAKITRAKNKAKKAAEAA